MCSQVLIVEDEEALSGIMSLYFSKAGFNTHIIKSGLDAKTWLSFNQPSLIILDRQLPGKDGLSLCKEIRERSNIPIIIASANNSEQDRLEGFIAGADDYLGKPFSARELLARAKAIIHRANL